MFQSALLIVHILCRIPHSLYNRALGIPLWKVHPCLCPWDRTLPSFIPQSSGPGPFSKILQHQWKLSMAVHANGASTVIRGAGAALVKSAEAEVLCVGGWFIRLFSRSMAKTVFISLLYKISVNNKCHSGLNCFVFVFCAMCAFDKNNPYKIRIYS